MFLFLFLAEVLFSIAVGGTMLFVIHRNEFEVTAEAIAGARKSLYFVCEDCRDARLIRSLNVAADRGVTVQVFSIAPIDGPWTRSRRLRYRQVSRRAFNEVSRALLIGTSSALVVDARDIYMVPPVLSREKWRGYAVRLVASGGVKLPEADKRRNPNRADVIERSQGVQ
jgi:hypothetical protein